MSGGRIYGVNKMLKITLTGNPMSTQHIYLTRGNSKGRFMKRGAKERKEQYQWEAKSQYKGRVLECPLTAEIVLYFGDRRRRDWDNFHKLACDALEGVVYEDDSQIQEAHVVKAYDKENPRTEILIHKL